MYVDLRFFFFKQKTAYEMRISDWSSDVCSSDLALAFFVIRSEGFDKLFSRPIHRDRAKVYLIIELALGARRFAAYPGQLSGRQINDAPTVAPRQVFRAAVGHRR